MILKKRSKLLEYNVSGKVSDHDFVTMNNECSEELALVETQINELEHQDEQQKEFKRQIEDVKNAMRTIEQAAATGAITKDFIEEYIDKIYITPENDHLMRLDVKIFTGESSKLYFEKLNGRAGHMSKKMIEAYEQGLQ